MSDQQADGMHRRDIPAEPKPRSKYANRSNKGVVAEQHALAAERKRQISLMRLSGVTSQSEVIRRFAREDPPISISRSAVSRYFKMIDDEYREAVRQEAAIYQGRAVSRLDALMVTAFPEATGPIDSLATRRHRLAAMDRVMKIIETEQKLLGYGAPEQVRVAGPDGGPVRIITSIEAIMPQDPQTAIDGVVVTGRNGTNGTNGTGYHVTIDSDPDDELGED